MSNKIILDVDSELYMIEEIILSIKQYEDLLFVKGRREPIYNRNELEHYLKMNIKVDNKPFHPFLSAYVVKDILYRANVELSGDTSLYVINKILNKESKIYNIDFYSELDVFFIGLLELYTDSKVKDLLNNKNIAKYLQICEDLFYKSLETLKVTRNHVIDINIESEYIIIKDIGDVRIHRYNEAEQIIYEENMENEVIRDPSLDFDRRKD